MGDVENCFIENLRSQMYAVECHIIRLYAESCYASIQGVYGNRTCMARAEELDDALDDALLQLKRLKQRMWRLGIPRSEMISLDDLQKTGIFTDQFCSHPVNLAGDNAGSVRRALDSMLADLPV